MSAKPRAAIGLAAILLLPSVAMAQEHYVYNVGPNYINQSGSSCRTESRATEADVYRLGGHIQVWRNAGKYVYCPLVRRNTTYYGVSGSDSQASSFANVNITVKASDTSTGDMVHCASFRTNVDNGTVYWGPTKFLCANSNGCDSGSLTYVGDNTMLLKPPTGAPLKSLNHGYRCLVPSLQRGTIHYAEAQAFANL